MSRIGQRCEAIAPLFLPAASARDTVAVARLTAAGGADAATTARAAGRALLGNLEEKYTVRFRAVVVLLALLGAVNCVHARAPARGALPADIKVPSDVTLAVYLPASDRKFRFYLDQWAVWMEPGKALEESVNATLKTYFERAFIADPATDQPYGLLLSIHPKLKFENGTIRQTMKYKVFGPHQEVLLEGDKQATAGTGDVLEGGSFAEVSLQAMRQIVIEVLTRLRPDAAKFPVAGKLADVPRELLVDKDSPLASGTGFFINNAGQVMTAAHVVQDCVVVDVQRDDKKLSGRIVASSNLVDLAVLDTGTPVARFLPFRQSFELNLGEPVTNVGFPLQKILAPSANLTRGNVSSRGALAGSVGQFQFSAPIQPGSSGGPVVSDGGELLGVTVATLDVRRLIETGALPQNVNFALEAHYAAMFLRKNHIAFTELEPNRKGDIRTGNEAALSTVVSLTCFQ